MNLLDQINEGTIKRFSDWEAIEQIFDDKKAFWMLEKPGSQYQKVCMFRDGNNMYIYGDYGRYSFADMTWYATPYNLQYNNLGYQTEKMRYEDREQIYDFDSSLMVEALKNWTKDRLCDISELSDEKINGILAAVFDDEYNSYNIDEYLEEQNLEDVDNLEEFLCFVIDARDSECSTRQEWFMFLSEHDLELQDYDNGCESSLYSAGEIYKANFLVSMYAMMVCGEKLKEKETELLCKEILDRSCINIAVHCESKQDAKEFLDILTHAGYRWPMSRDLFLHGEEIGPGFYYFLRRGLLTYSNPEPKDDVLKDQTIVEYADIQEALRNKISELEPESPCIEKE